MLAKKSAFDILMNKNKLKEKVTTSDSDSDIIVIKDTKNKTLRKSPEKENDSNVAIINKQSLQQQKSESQFIQSSFVSQDTSFTIAPHTSQLTQFDFNFLTSFKYQSLKFKPECALDINTIELNKTIIKIEQEQCENKSKRTSKKESQIKKIEKSDSNNTQIEENHDLWTEKYMFTSEDDIVTNSGQFERLKEWLKNWKSILSNEDTKNSKEKICDSGSEYSYDSDASTIDSSFSGYKKKFYNNAILLSGPYGCGKTSSVHLVAKQLGFKIFEVNSSSLRCKTQIIQELEGAMNSHHVSSNTIPSTTNKSSNNDFANMFSKSTNNDVTSFKLEKFFKSQQTEKTKPATTKTRQKKRKISLRKETVLSVHNKTRRRSKKHKKDDNTESEQDEIEEDEPIQLLNNNSHVQSTNEESSVNIHRESLILFDEVDVVFREDVGFLAAINHFLKKSKKPIILTTNDDFLQDKINLNIEKITFVRPRVDAAIKYLKRVSKQENFELDTPTAYKIIGECKCDMRRALLQLQTLVSSSHISSVKMSENESNDLNNYIPDSLTTQNVNHFENFYFLDKLTKELKTNDLNTNNENSYKKYDLVLLKDGLSDNSLCTNVSTFNPFLPINSISNSNSIYDFSNDTTPDKLLKFELYDEYMRLFNKNTLIQFNEWSKHGLVDQFNYASNSSINKFAQTTFKSTMCRSVSLEYRPFLQLICQTEEKNQMNSTAKRRYLHYLHYSNLGLVKEDFQLLAKSNLSCKDSVKSTGVEREIISKNDDIFSS